MVFPTREHPLLAVVQKQAVFMDLFMICMLRRCEKRTGMSFDEYHCVSNKLKELE
jgi:hypothetical protein